MRELSKRLHDAWALIALIAGLWCTTSALADWPASEGAKARGGNCYAQQGVCCKWGTACVNIGTNPDFPDMWYKCNPHQPDGTVWRSLKSIQSRQYGICQGNPPATCPQWDWYYCVRVEVYRLDDCPGSSAVCTYYSPCSEKCEPN